MDTPDDATEQPTPKKPPSTRTLAYKSITRAFLAVAKSQGFERHNKRAFRRTDETIVTLGLDPGTWRSWAYIKMSIWIRDLPPDKLVGLEFHASDPIPVWCPISMVTEHLAGAHRDDLNRAVGYLDPHVSHEERLDTLSLHIAESVEPLVDRCGTKHGLAAR